MHVFIVMMKLRLICLACLFLAPVASHGDEPQNLPIQKLGEDFKLVGKLHVPLGSLISVSGVVVEGPFKGYEGGPNLRVQEIQGRYCQEDIQIDLSPFLYPWGYKPIGGGNALPKLKVGQSYEMEGYETGGFIGAPYEVFRRSEVQIAAPVHRFLHQFVVTKAEEIEPITYAPSMFSGEKALLTGIAKSVDGDSALVGEDWMVVVTRGAKWGDDIEGKKIESYGLYNPDATWKEHPDSARKKFDLVDGWWRLVELEDQVGRQVSLRGTARSLNGEWWFHYRGTDLYVDDMEKLPGWTAENHWRPMQIEGRLERAKLPRLDQVSLKPDRDLGDYFIVRDPSWKPLPALLAPERVFPPLEEQAAPEQPDAAPPSKPENDEDPFALPEE